MNKTLLRAALAGAAFTFALPAAAASEVTYTFDSGDFVQDAWTNPYNPSGDETFGFRLTGGQYDFSLTAFGAYDPVSGNNSWDNTTVVLGFTAAPRNTYSIDWANSWLDVDTGRITLADLLPANLHTTGDDWLAADIWGGNGLTAGTAWAFTVPTDFFNILGGQITYNVTVPEPATLVLLLGGLGLVGAGVGRRWKSGRR